MRSVPLTVAAVLALLATPAAAESLREALLKAYQTNPQLAGARANQRANDENVPIARSRGLPELGATGGFNQSIRNSQNDQIGGETGGGSASIGQPSRAANANLNLTVPIYQGGAVRNSIRAADQRVLSGRENLRDTEAGLFASVVEAYMDVIRDSAIVSLNQAQVNVLSVNAQATRDRFQVGDLTRTDVAQSESRLALSRGDLQNAEARLINSKESYVRLVGSAPGTLEPPPPLPNLPISADSAVAIAVENNPGLAAAARERDAARFDTSVARASRLPSLSIVTTGGYTNFLGSFRASNIPLPQTQTTISAGAQVSLPLFQGGRPAAQIRQAQARESQAIENVTLTERNIVAQTRSAFANYRASNELIATSQTAIDASALSLEGVRAENTVGNRTILDILDAEQELLRAQSNLVAARRNAYVAGFTLLAAMGRADADDLGLEGGALYDPTVNYNRVRRRLNDFSSDPAPVPQGTRTVDTPAQTSALIGPSPR